MGISSRASWNVTYSYGSRALLEFFKSIIRRVMFNLRVCAARAHIKSRGKRHEDNRSAARKYRDEVSIARDELQLTGTVIKWNRRCATVVAR